MLQGCFPQKKCIYQIKPRWFQNQLHFLPKNMVPLVCQRHMKFLLCTLDSWKENTKRLYREGSEKLEVLFLPHHNIHVHALQYMQTEVHKHTKTVLRTIDNDKYSRKLPGENFMFRTLEEEEECPNYDDFFFPSQYSFSILISMSTFFTDSKFITRYPKLIRRTKKGNLPQ